MKKILLSIVMTFLFCVAAMAADITFEWDANTESDLAGYKIYSGAISGGYGKHTDVGNVTTYTLKGVPDGTWYFAATAYDTSGNESKFSNEIKLTIDSVPPGMPSNFKVTITEVKSVTVGVE